MDFIVENNRKEVMKATEQAIMEALKVCGGVAETHAKENAPVISSNLKNSISHVVDTDKQECIIGTAVEYAPFVEYGTGIYNENGASQGWWVYVKGQESSKEHKGKRYSYEVAKSIVAKMRAKGLDAYMTQGQKPTHFLRKAITENMEEYQNIIAQTLKNNME